MNRQEFLEKVDGGTDWKVYDKKLFEGIVDATLKVAAEIMRSTPKADPEDRAARLLESLRNTKGANAVYSEA